MTALSPSSLHQAEGSLGVRHKRRMGVQGWVHPPGVMEIQEMRAGPHSANCLLPGAICRAGVKCRPHCSSPHAWTIHGLCYLLRY
jgi:hypothetical protein